MSRSRKKNIVIKDKTGRWYNKCVRSHQNQQVRSILTLEDKLTYEISHPKNIVDSYDICDWVLDYRRRRMTKKELEQRARK